MKYNTIYQHYESCLEKHGDTPKGHDWPNAEELIKRYEVMHALFKEEEKCSLLDLGCGTGLFLEYLNNNNISNINYEGADISDKFLSISKNKFKNNKFYQIDIISEELPKNYDYIIANGIFTMKIGLQEDEMFNFFTTFIKNIWSKCNKGIAFNVMSKNVSWERDDLFHLGLDKLTKFLCDDITRNWVVINNYGLYEYTVYIYK